MQTSEVPIIDMSDEMNKNAFELTLNAMLMMITAADITAQESTICAHRDKKTQLDKTARNKLDSLALSVSESLRALNELRKADSLRLFESADSFLSSGLLDTERLPNGMSAESI
jgi:hypothetical protein